MGPRRETALAPIADRVLIGAEQFGDGGGAPEGFDETAFAIDQIEHNHRKSRSVISVNITNGAWTSRSVIRRLLRMKDEPASEKARAIGARLRHWRKAVGLTPAQVYRGIDVPQSAWSQWETGERAITTDPAERLCLKYRLTLDYIYRGITGSLPGDLMVLLEGTLPEPSGPRSSKPARAKKGPQSSGFAPKAQRNRAGKVNR